MKKTFNALLGAALFASTANAAGVNKIVRATIDETQLQGFVAPPLGFLRNVDYSAATPASDPVQKIAALVSYRSATFSNVPPPPAAITTISLANGALLTKDNLPGPAQITAAECAPTCPNFLMITVMPDTALPSRLIINVIKQNLTSAFFRSVTYAFDPAGPAGSGTRWTLLQNLTGGVSIGVLPSVLNGGGTPNRNFYTFTRLSPTSMQIVQIVNK